MYLRNPPAKPVASASLMSFKPRGLKIKSNPPKQSLEGTPSTAKSDRTEKTSLQPDHQSNESGQTKNNSDFRAYFPS
jgi:hypothetical protein